MTERVKIRRDANVALQPFKDYFRGFEDLGVLRELFGDKVSEVLDSVKLEFYSGGMGYMAVADEDGHVRINAKYLKEGEERCIYLDIIHELVHVRQFKDSKNLRDPNFEYVDRPTEIEAYKVAVQEARNIGMHEDEIFQYLKMERMDDRTHRRLARNVGVRVPHSVGKAKKEHRKSTSFPTK